VQIFEFFKVLLDNDQTEKKVEFNDIFYKEVLSAFLTFLTTIEDLKIPSEEEEKAPQGDSQMLEATA
jgi:hypothetical protein